MIPTSVFPKIAKLYPKLMIVNVKRAWSISLGWSTPVYSKFSIVSQIRILKEQGFKEVTLLLRDEKTNHELTMDFAMAELDFCRPAKQKRRFQTVFLL